MFVKFSVCQDTDFIVYCGCVIVADCGTAIPDTGTARGAPHVTPISAMKTELQLSILCSVLCLVCTEVYVLDNSPGLGRRFDGIGGLSAGAVRIYCAQWRIKCTSFTT